MMTREQVKRELQRFAYDPKYKGRHNKVPLQTLARYAGLSRKTLIDIVHGARQAGDKTVIKLSPVIERIIAGELKFVRTKYEWEIREIGNANPHVSVSQPQLPHRV
jgi:hypothetical protein